MPRLRVAAITAIVVVLLFGIVGYFAIPKIVRWGVETVATRELGRAVRVQEITANPFNLRVTLRGLEVAGAAGETAPLLTVQELIANASVGSVLRLAPVLDALSIDGLTANLVRLDAERFNFSDIVDRIRSRPKTSDEPARFSVSNIEVTNGNVNLDDRPTGRKHAVTELRIGVPFVSSLPTHAEITVQPAFAARLDGARVEAKGETRPFKQTLETSINVKLDGIDIPTYLPYSPVALNFAVPRGKLGTDLRIAFRLAAPAEGNQPAVPAQVLVSGSFSVNDFALSAPREQPQPLLAWKALQVVLEEVEPLANRAVIADVALVAPAIEVRREGNGEVNWVRFAQAPLRPGAVAASAPKESAAAPKSPPLALTLKHASIKDGTVALSDDSAGRFRIQVVNLAGEASNLTTTTTTRGKVRVSGEIAEGAGSISAEGDVALAPVAGTLNIASRDVKMRTVARYLANVVNATVDGSSDVDAVLDFALEPTKSIVVRDIRWQGKNLKVRGPAGTGAEFDLSTLSMEAATLDLLKRQLVIGKVALDGPRATVRRLADGQINWLSAFHKRPSGTAEDKPAADAGDAGWNVSVKEASIARGDLALEDFAVDPQVKLRASAISGTVRNLVSDGTQRAEFDLRTRLGRGGSFTAVGGARWNPIAADARVDARNLDIAALRPYLAKRLDAVLTRAEVSARGSVTASKAGAEAPLAFGYKGSSRVTNLQLLDARGEDDLLKWQVLELEQIAVSAGKDPPNVSVGKVTLSDFYARIIVSEQGRLNLVDVIRRTGEGAPSSAPKAARTAPNSATKADAPAVSVDREMAAAAEPAPAAQRPRSTTAETPSVEGADVGPRPVIRIGHIDIMRGNVNFTDNFIKPNYTANMTGLSGSVTTLASDSGEPATMTIAGFIDNEAPVDIKGRLNPLAPKLYLDIEGGTKGVDLPRLTPYSVKYAGYPIVKGKLSMEVKYKVEDGKLAANNHLFLDQLTFGDKVESPTATKLPVLLAVSLLKNSRGEIDLNLPISGTLDDPKFSVGAVIVQVIVNLLTKVVTAPFTLLASAFGGGEELGLVEFAPGSASLVPEQIKRVDSLSKALNERPGLKLDIIGRVDPALDTDAVRRAKLDSKLRAAKVRRTVRASGEAVDPATVTISDAERPELMAAVYSSEDIPNKPRNFIGIAKSIPPAEMEALIVAHLAVTPEDLRALASQRATAVRNRLESEGKVSRERLFLVEPKLTAEGIKDKGATTRVDLSLK